MPLRDFYTSTAQACFTVLSVWWVILGLHKHWIRDAQRRLMVYDVSLYFLLPGLMSLVSLLSVGVPTLWRAVFALAGIAGAVESAVLPVRRGLHGSPGRFVQVADWLSFLVFSLITAVAVVPSLPHRVGVGLSGLATEGTLISVLLVIGFAMAWRMFVTATHEDAEVEPEPEPVAVVSASRSTGRARARSRRWWRTSGAWELAGGSQRRG